MGRMWISPLWHNRPRANLSPGSDEEPLPTTICHPTRLRTGLGGQWRKNLWWTFQDHNYIKIVTFLSPNLTFSCIWSCLKITQPIWPPENISSSQRKTKKHWLISCYLLQWIICLREFLKARQSTESFISFIIGLWYVRSVKSFFCWNFLPLVIIPL